MTTGVRRRLRAAAVMVVALGLAAGLAACTSSDDPAVGSGSGSGALGASDPSPGLTATTAKIGFVIIDLGELQESLGFLNTNYGGVEGVTAQIQAVVNAVNTNGGLGGRQIEPVIRVYEGALDSPETAEALCNDLTQDEQVFAVVMDGQLQNNARACYAQRKTIMIDETLIAQDQAEFEKYAPYLWSPTFPEYGGFLDAQLNALRDSGFLNGSQGVAIVGVDNEVARRQVEQTVLPFLAANGGVRSAQFYVDGSNIGTLGATSSAALVGAQAQGLDRVVTVGGARILAVMLADPAANDLVARYAVSTYDSPLFLQDNPTTIVTKTLNGMVGFGAMPGRDLGDDPGVPFPDPANQSQSLCKSIIDAAQATPPKAERANYTLGFQYCDGVMFLKATLDLAGANVTAESFREAAWRTGTTYSSAATFGGSLTAGRYAASNVGRTLAYEPSCQNPTTGTVGCFQYRGSDVVFGNG